MTVTRGLAELKLLDKKINRKISSLHLIGKDLPTPPESQIQSVEDLITERSALKMKIMTSNYATKVTIDGKSITVLQAIEMKTTMEYQSKLCQEMRNQFLIGMREVEQKNLRVEQDLQKILEAAAGTGGTLSDEQIESISKPFLASRTVSLETGGYNLQEKIEAYIEKYENFISEIDFILSESNSITTL